MAQIEDSVNDASGPTSRQIQADIDRTRSNMDQTFDAIESKLTPGQLLQEAWGIFKGGSGAGANKALKIAKQHPLPSAVIGLGIGWLLLDSSRKTAGSRSYDGRERGAAVGAVKDAAESAKDFAVHAKDKVSDLASQAGDKLGDLTDKVREQASDLSDKVKEQASELGEKVHEGARKAQLGFWQLLEARPLMVGAATLAVGLLVGLSIPSTDVEDELMGETRDQLLDSAKDTGREVLDKGKQVANATVDAVKHAAEEQNLTVNSLTEKVKAVASQARETVASEAKNQHLVPEEAELVRR
jgi:gas vesicle protein